MPRRGVPLPIYGNGANVNDWLHVDDHCEGLLRILKGGQAGEKYNLGDQRYAIDATKVGREIGWRPRHSFEDGIRETVDWYLRHQDWCEAVQTGRYDRERLGLGG